MNGLTNSDMDYISFGKGNKILIMLPGLGDGLKTVKGTSLFFAAAYREYGKHYKVYVFSRKNKLEEGYTTRDMARDMAAAMKELGISRADFLGVSQGGMIAQYVAINYPNLVNKVILAVTLSKQNDTIQQAIRSWISMAESGSYKDLIIDTAEKSYSEKYIKKYRLLYPIIGRIGRPKDFNRFLIQANACLHHDSYNELGRITCKTLIIGGGRDKIAGTNSSLELADAIPGSKLHIYNDLGHGAYEEAKDFNSRCLDFLISDSD